MNANSDRWDDADFGEVPHQIEASGQSTIFFSDSAEPPAPDEYPTIPAYEQAHQEWASQNQPQLRSENKEDTTEMATAAFQFSATQQITDQITQIQEQLNQLVASLKPLQECQQKAEELRSQVAEYGNEMADKGIPQADIIRWAKALYSAVSGTEFIDSGSDALAEALSSDIAAQNEIIAKLKNEAAIARNEATMLQKAERDKMSVETTRHFTEEEFLRKDALKLTVLVESAITERDNVIALLERVQNENVSLVEALQQLEALTEDVESQQTDAATIEVLQKENASLIIKIQGLETASMLSDTKLAEFMPTVQTLTLEIEELKQEIVSLETANCLLRERSEMQAHKEHLYEEEGYTKILNIGDMVRTYNEVVEQEVTLEDSERIGKVIGFVDKFIVVKLSDGEFNFRRDCLEWISTPSAETLLTLKQEAKHPNIKAQVKAREFMATIRSKTGMNNIDWEDVSEACQGDRDIFTEIQLSATTKFQKELIERLPTLMADYISETGDITDLSWVGDTFTSIVEELLEVKKSLPYHSKDWVRCLETGETWEVKSFDGEWVYAVKGNKITSLHKSEVELLIEVTA
jgi:hypothetical protein